MGEPVVGDIADGIRLTTNVIKLKTNITGLKGDFLIKDAANDWFTKVATTVVGEVLAAVTDPGVYQAQADSWWGAGLGFLEDATHWMPRPKPPAEKA